LQLTLELELELELELKLLYVLMQIDPEVIRHGPDLMRIDKIVHSGI